MVALTCLLNCLSLQRNHHVLHTACLLIQHSISQLVSHNAPSIFSYVNNQHTLPVFVLIELKEEMHASFVVIKGANNFHHWSPTGSQHWPYIFVNSSCEEHWNNLQATIEKDDRYYFVLYHNSSLPSNVHLALNLNRSEYSPNYTKNKTVNSCSIGPHVSDKCTAIAPGIGGRKALVVVSEYLYPWTESLSVLGTCNLRGDTWTAIWVPVLMGNCTFFSLLFVFVSICIVKGQRKASERRNSPRAPINQQSHTEEQVASEDERHLLLDSDSVNQNYGSHLDRPSTASNAGINEGPALPDDKPIVEITSDDKPIVEITSDDKPIVEITSDDKPIVEITSDDKPIVEITSDDKPIVEITSDDKPIVEITSDDKPIVEITSDDKPIVEITSDDKPIVEITSDDKPIVEITSDDKPIVEITSDDKPIVEITSDDKPIVEIASEDTSNHEPVLC